MLNTILSGLGTAGVIVIVILLFNFMIFVHELGHFFAARWRGMYVDRFQIWFGKPLWKKTINGVQWGLGWIPAGGFVSLPQMAPMEAIEGEVELPKDLKPVTALDKIIVAAAGPVSSFLLAVAFALVVWGLGKPGVEFPVTTVGYIPADSPAAASGLKPGDKILEIDGNPVTQWTGNMEGVRERIMLGEGTKIRFLVQRPGVDKPLEFESGFKIPETRWWQRSAMRQIGILPAGSCVVGEVVAGSPAEKAGLKSGDVLMALNGEKLWSPAAVALSAKAGVPMKLTVRHADGKESIADVTPEIPANWKGYSEARAITGIQWKLGDEIRETTLYPTPWEQVGQSLKWMGDTMKKVFAPNSDISMEHLSGPIGIAGYFYNMLQTDGGWKLALWFAVVLNINLAVLNILPLPVVDGGHVVLGTAEILLKRPVSGRILDFVQTGFVFLLMGFFLFVSFKDVGDFFKPSDAEKELPAPVFAAVAGSISSGTASVSQD